MMTCRALLRTATQAPHERLHQHDGLRRVQLGTVTLSQYRRLLARLYGFYLPFERAAGTGGVRTEWLREDLMQAGAGADGLSNLRVCTAIPHYDSAASRLGGLYVVEGSAFGGRQLFDGLNTLFGTGGTQGRRFFAGHGSAASSVWLDFLDQLAALDNDPASHAALVQGAVATFTVFEAWLAGWSATE